MKRIYQRLNLSAFLFTTAGKYFLPWAVICLASTFTSFGHELVFQDPILVSGVAGLDNATYRFPKVTSAVDNLVNIKMRSASNVVIENIEVTEPGSLSFRSFSYIEGTFLPAKLASFTAKSMTTNKVVLNWSTSQEKDASHFTIEKSLNGKDFSDAGILFSIGNSEVPQQYNFTDEIRTGEKGLIYYRLKLVDLDGQIQYSPIRLVRIGEEKANASILVYPNPVANELRVTLPATWHDKKVTIDIYTQNGVLAKRFVTNYASQTETINVRALTPGSYMIRSSNGTDTTSQHIIKTN